MASKIRKSIWLFLIFLFPFMLHAAIPDSVLVQISDKKGDEQIKYILTQANNYFYSDPNISEELIRCIEPHQNDTLDVYLDYYWGLLYHFKSNPDSAIHYYTQAKKKIEDSGEEFSIYENVLNNLGVIYDDQGLYTSAIDLYLSSLRIEEQEGDSLGIAESYTNLGVAHMNILDYSEAKEYFLKALLYFKRINHDRLIATNLNNLGALANMHGDYKLAIDYLLEAGNYQKKNQNIHGEVLLMENLSEGYFKLELIDSLQSINNEIIKSLDTSILIRAKKVFVANQGRIAALNHQYRKAIQFFQRAYWLAQQSGVFNQQISLTRKTIEAYLALNEPELANKYAELYFELKDSMWSSVHDMQIQSLKKRYESEKEERHSQMLEKKLMESDLKLKNLRTKQIALGGMVIVLIVSLIVVLRNVRIRKEALREIEAMNKLIKNKNSELNSLNATKDRFFSILAHDLKNPFSTILGYSSLLSKDWENYTEEERKDFANILNESTYNTFQLLQNLLTWSRSQSGKLPCNPQKVEMAGIIYEVIGLVDAMARKKQIEIKIDIENECTVFADDNMMRQLLLNLLTNAIKFSARKSEVELYGSCKSDQWTEIIVKDYGMGMSEEQIQQAFRLDSKIHMKGTEGEEGTGLGLILVKEFTERLNGTIEVESKEGQGSSFILKLPRS